MPKGYRKSGSEVNAQTLDFDALDPRAVVARNLKRLMAASSDLRSQSALARRSGVPQTTISDYLAPEKHGKWPSLEGVHKLASAFGIEAWQLCHPSLGDISKEQQELFERFRALMAAHKPK